jgi:hypothetical protein
VECLTVSFCSACVYRSLVLVLELLVAIHHVAKVYSPFLDMSNLVVSLVIRTTYLLICVVIINSPDCRNNLSELVADTCI